MANEIVTSFISGDKIDAYIFDKNKQFWYIAGKVFEDWCSDPHLAADYAIALSEISDTGVYVGDFDQNISIPGMYYIQLKRRAGSEPANSDIPLTVISYPHRITITEEPGDTNLCLLSDVKDRLGLSQTDTQYDDVLTRIILGLEDIFNNTVSRPLILTDSDITEYFTGLGRFLQLNRYPVVSIASLKQALDYDFANTDALEQDVDYRIVNNGKNGIVHLINLLWFEMPDSIQAIYRGGYCPVGEEPAEGETALPGDIREAAILQATFIFKRRDDIGLSGVGFQGGSISKFSDIELLPMVKNILDNYRKPSL